MKTWSLVRKHPHDLLETLGTFVDREKAFMTALHCITGKPDKKSYSSYEEAFKNMRASLGQQYNASQHFVVESEINLI